MLGLQCVVRVRQRVEKLTPRELLEMLKDTPHSLLIAGRRGRVTWTGVTRSRRGYRSSTMSRRLPRARLGSIGVAGFPVTVATRGQSSCQTEVTPC